MQTSAYRYLLADKGLCQRAISTIDVPNAPYLPNKLRHYPAIYTHTLPLPQVLPIFGKANDHLERHCTVTNLLTGAVFADKQYTFILDGDGYIQQKRTKNMATNITQNSPLWVYEPINMDLER